MKIAVFSTKPYDRTFLEAAAARYQQELTFFEPRLTQETAALAIDFTGVCIFVNDQANAAVLQQLAHQGIRLIALRCAGFNNVDLAAAEKHHLAVVRVPAYSPHAVAEHTVALLLTLDRKIHRAYQRVREGNFSLDGLLGFDLYGRTIGVIGTGKIGFEFAKIMLGFGCQVLAHDLYPNDVLRQRGVRYVSKEELFAQSDVVSLHCPLTPDTYHLINQEALAQMKPGVILINTSRGALVDTKAVIQGLKSGKIGHLGLDVYEEEADLFFEDLSDTLIHDDVFSRLMTFPNVVVTGHQAFFTRNAMEAIADTTLSNIAAFERGELQNQVKVEKRS